MDPTDTPQRLYGGRFLLVFAILFAYMCGHSMLVHLPKYVVALGGDIATVGGIFGIGMVGSLVTRPFVGRWIDRAGCRTVLLAATLLAAASVFAFPWVQRIELVLGLRVLVQMALAAMLATVAVLAARIAPPGRSAECLAMIGIGGLGGLMVGPIIGDVIFGRGVESNPSFIAFFSIAAGVHAGAFLLALATPSTRIALDAGIRRPPFWRLMVDHWPGAILVVALCLAFAQAIPVMFIERFVVERDIGRVTLFFAAYSPTAIGLRVVLRRLPARLGRKRTLLLGMAAYVIGLLLLTRVEREVDLLLPAVVAGMGHCFSYPFLVDLAAERMPNEHRGVATSIVLGALDLGFLIAFVVEGALIDRYGFTLALITVAATCAAGVSWYAWTQRSRNFQPQEQAGFQRSPR